MPGIKILSLRWPTSVKIYRVIDTFIYVYFKRKSTQVFTRISSGRSWASKLYSIFYCRISLPCSNERSREKVRNFGSSFCPRLQRTLFPMAMTYTLAKNATSSATIANLRSNGWLDVARGRNPKWTWIPARVRREIVIALWKPFERIVCKARYREPVCLCIRPMAWCWPIVNGLCII